MADCERRSRSRYREIDRDTVLRINRHRPRRQFSWPPKSRAQSADGVPRGCAKGERRDLSLDSKLSNVRDCTAGATFAEDLSALQQRGELAQQQRVRRKGASCLPPPKPRRSNRDTGQGSNGLDASHQAQWHRNSSTKSQHINRWDIVDELEPTEG